MFKYLPSGVHRPREAVAYRHTEGVTSQLEQKAAFKNVEPFLKRVCMEGRAMAWWSNVLQHGDGARLISTREFDPHVFPNEVDWTTRDAFSGAYDLLRRECGLGRLLRHMNRGR